MFRCTVEGHTDVVVTNPPAARRWMQENGVEGHWREAFERERGRPAPETETAPSAPVEPSQ